jgi:hypothetical protein
MFPLSPSKPVIPNPCAATKTHRVSCTKPGSDFNLSWSSFQSRPNCLREPQAATATNYCLEGTEPSILLLSTLAPQSRSSADTVFCPMLISSPLATRSEIHWPAFLLFAFSQVFFFISLGPASMRSKIQCSTVSASIVPPFS